MRIEIDISAANDPNAHKWLDRILHKIEDGWHVWDTDSESNPDAFEDTTWIRGDGRQGDWVREMLVASIQRRAWSLAPHERRVRVTACPNGEDELKPEDATRLAEEPLVILVENRVSDGAFVERVVKELDNSLQQLWNRPGEPVRLDSLGGTGQMPDEVERRTQGKPYRPRLVAIIDSDRKSPDDTDSTAARKLCRKCKTLGVACWVLAKRETENYLPRILLDERQNVETDHDQLVGAWDRLNDDQKDFFDMKDGLPEVPCEIEKELFDGLSPIDRSTLSSGFGSDVYTCWTLWKVQAKSELQRRGRGDLERGIDLIRKEV